MVVKDVAFQPEKDDALPPGIEPFLARFQETSKRYDSIRAGEDALHGDARMVNRQLLYEEGVLEEGERVAVYGRCVLEPDPQAFAGYRQQPMRLVIQALGDVQLLISDDPAVIS